MEENTKMKKRWIAFALAFAMILALLPVNRAVTAYAANPDAEMEAGAVNSVDYSDIIEQIDPTADAFDFNSEEARAELLAEAETYPASFDLRNVDGRSYVTPVRSQAPFGTCWGFAAIGAAESSILGAGLNGADGQPATPATLNLSEKQLAYFSAVPLNDPSNSQNGEGQLVEDFITTQSLLDRGGNACIATSVLAQGVGPEHESTEREESNGIFEYRGKEGTIVYDHIDGKVQAYSYSYDDDWSMPEKYRFYNSYLLKDARILPAPAGRNGEGFYEYNEAATAAIKQELLNKRAVMVSFCADTTLPNQSNDNSEYISNNWAHYTYVPSGSNHMVTVVGWDDNYSRDNFLSGQTEMKTVTGETIVFDKTPPADGAWLVKNSWGSGEVDFPDKGQALWGIENEDGVHTGYFWLSYYDQSLLDAASLILEESENQPDYIDQFDYMPMNDTLSYASDSEMKEANIFRARGNEVLEYVSCFTTAPETDVRIEIYLMSESIHSPEEGIKVAEQNFHYTYGGYHKEALSDFDILFNSTGTESKDVVIMKDQAYSIVVTQKSPEGKYLVNFNYGYGEEGGGVSSFKGIINPEESWMLKDEAWEDYSYADSLREEMADVMLSSFDFYEFENITFDNFPIKGFCRSLGKNLTIAAADLVSMVYKTASGSKSVAVFVYGDDAETAVNIQDDDVTWQILDDGNKYIELSPGRNPLRKIATAIDAEDDALWFYCAVTIKNVGTTVFKIGVVRNIARDLVYYYDEEAGGNKIVYTYTGEEIKAIEYVDVTTPPVVEGVDYEIVYRDNIKCGIASATFRGLGGMFKEADGPTAQFVIVPQKAEITSIKEGKEGLTVTVKDMSEQGLEGYHFWYRKQGSKKWQETEITADKTQVVISGVKAGIKYEVKAAGYVKNPGAEDPVYPVVEPIYYGEESDVVVSGSDKNDISGAVVAFSGLEKTKAGQYWTAYDGAAKKPAVTVTLAGTELTADDYDVTYSENKNVGTATATVTGKGSYTGSASGTFLITFKDVPATHNFQKAVYWAVEQGIAAGYTGDKAGTFGVNDNITRGQVVMFLWRAAGNPEAGDLKTQTFSDVKTSSAFYKAIQWASEGA